MAWGLSDGWRLTDSDDGGAFEQKARFPFHCKTMIRHALPPGTVAATSFGMQNATARARLIASASFSLMIAAGFLCAGSDAVDLATVASSTDKNL